MEGLPGYPVERDIDILLDRLAVKVMEGDCDEFDDDFDDDLLRALPLDFPSEDEEAEKEDDDDCFIVPNIKQEPAEPPRDFPFPFTPYDIQVGFMQQLYRVLENSKIGIFESPTGTGKSLSLICGALQWLRDHEERERQELQRLLMEEEAYRMKIKREKEAAASGELDWIAAYAKKQELSEKTQKIKDECEQRLKREARLNQLRKNVHPKNRKKRKRGSLESQFDELMKDASKELKDKFNEEITTLENETIDLEDDTLVVPEYFSDDDTKGGESSEEEEEEFGDDHVTKIYYCSRTHSQLAQFVREIQKSPFGEDTRVVTLGSRQTLCINPSVRSLKSMSLINERCLELQKNKTATKKVPGESVSKKKKTCSGCPFYKQERLAHFTDRILVDIHDMEQLASTGRRLQACPFYASRLSIPAAQLVALPYQLILHRAARQSSGISLRGNIVIIDEAHNLVETITNIHSVEVTGAQLLCAYSQLSQYMEKFRTRLKAKNLMYIKQILFILSNLVKCIGGKTTIPANQQRSGRTETRLQTINDFLFDSHLDNLNLFKVLRYCERSKISRKLHGYVEKYQPQEVQATPEVKPDEPPTWALSKFLKEISQNKAANKNNRVSGVKPVSEAADDLSYMMSSPLMHIESFLEALTNANKDGRIVINKQELLSQTSLKFLLLNPVVHFHDIVSEARSVIVAGGTMQPLAEFKQQLFYAAGASPEQIIEYACGHVIPDSNLLPLALGRGSSGMELDFTYGNRDSPRMMSELGRVIYNLCHIVPGGIVVFFPSYEHERVVFEHWAKEGFLKKMCMKKKVFREPKKASQADSVLSEYSACIKNAEGSMTGAMLLCVVGGKMSEGINFSDELGRCVVMVGLPYPNMRSPELKEKMDYLNATLGRGSDGKLPGQQHYENLCFKALNQSIGRAIRHREDYASIVLLDQRYLRQSMRSKLPEWIGNKLRSEDRFGPGFNLLRKFYSEKAKEEQLRKQVKTEPPEELPYTQPPAAGFLPPEQLPSHHHFPIKQEAGVVRVKQEKTG